MGASGVIAVDDGGYSTGVVTKKVSDIFPSVKGLYGRRTLTDTEGRHDFVVDYKGERYVMGTLAKYDCKYPLQMHTKTKQHIFFDLSTLVAIHQYGYLENYLITSVPISIHNEIEKSGRIQRLIGKHTIGVNGNYKTFKVLDVKVAPETASAFWINEPTGKTRYIDLGSRTIGYATTINEGGIVRFIDTESGTFDGKGLEALDSDYNERALADYICGKLMAIWSEKDDIFLIGGGALDAKLVMCIREYFPYTAVISNPQMANSTGMYLLGRRVYNMV